MRGATRSGQRPAARQEHQQARRCREPMPPTLRRQTPPPERMARETEQTGQATSQRHHQDGRPATRPGQQERYDKQQRNT